MIYMYVYIYVCGVWGLKKKGLDKEDWEKKKKKGAGGA